MLTERRVALTVLPSSHLSLGSLVPSPQVREPAVQVQLLALVLPASEDAPAAQSLQAEDPAVAEYLPAPQSAQVEATAAEYLPAPQSAQVEATLAPAAAENLPATQLVQAVDRTTWPYFPASQLVQAVEAAAAE
jgi:hypothetical protein